MSESGYLYEAFVARPKLSSIIDAYWTNAPRKQPTKPSLAASRVLPDGCIDLIFRRTPGGGGRLFTSPLIEEASPLGMASGDWFVGVRFRPAMAHVALGIDPSECRNRVIAAVDVDKEFARLEDELLACATPREALAVLRRNVEPRVMGNAHKAAPARVRYTLSRLGEGLVAPVRELALHVGLSERSLHRELVRWTGLSPKALDRIFRMQSAMAHMREGRQSLAAIASESGYANQAHMTREFVKLAGAPPSRLFLQSPADVRNVQDARRYGT